MALPAHLDFADVLDELERLSRDHLAYFRLSVGGGEGGRDAGGAEVMAAHGARAA